MNFINNFKDFSRMVKFSRQEICREILDNHSGNIKIKKEKTLVKNLMHILDAALTISNEKGFQAMSMRNLSKESGLSMGGLYSYFSGKEELLEMLMSTGHITTRKILAECVADIKDPLSKLRAVIRAHIFLSEAIKPWFYFSYMEARHLGPDQKERAKAGEMETERILADILDEGKKNGVFDVENSLLMASAIKAMLQDWYVKRWKFAKRGISVDEYAGFVLEFVESFILS